MIPSTILSSPVCLKLFWLLWLLNQSSWNSPYRPSLFVFPCPFENRDLVIHNDDAALSDRVSALEAQDVPSDTELAARVSALENRAVPSDVLTATALSKAVAERFGEITSDRNELNAAMRKQAETQTRINAELRLKNKDLYRSLESVLTTLVRLELGGSAPPAPKTARKLAPTSTSDYSGIRPAHSRARSPARDLPAKRAKLQGFLTMGPFPRSNLDPHDLFMSVLTPALPTFIFTAPFSVILHPVHPYHLRVTLDFTQDMKTLLTMWNTGSRTIGMKASI
ncbi:hypothetical protein B0H13DRAFT_1907562 [Mycena leptocephala]|nr:hypothetical protein B0H13DRAFT_1907562 [Mycena leptocephala]